MLHVVHHRVTPSIKFVGTIYTQPNRAMSFITYHFRSTERARSRPVPLFEKRKLSSTFQTGEQLVMGSNIVYSHCRVATGHEMAREEKLFNVRENSSQRKFAFEEKSAKTIYMYFQSHLFPYTSFFSKAALKHADSQGVIEKMEQEMARLKLKHSLEVKVSQEVGIRLKQLHHYSSRSLLQYVQFW